MHAFHLFVRVLAVKDVQDTQCGFKLFTRAAAQRIFPNQHIQRWAFDCELLYLAAHFGIPARAACAPCALPTPHPGRERVR